MRCLVCENFSFSIICSDCQKNLLTPTFNKREIEKDFFVYSFYNYDEIKEFINTKYEFYGDRVFNILGKLAFKKFGQNFEFNRKVNAVAVDDHTRHEFSQTAILIKYLKSKNIKPVFNTLKASNIVKYAGRDLEFRKKNQRVFKYNGKKGLDVILVDDIITTGTTLLEAKNLLEINKCKVLFCLCLSDAKFQ
jgi:competence protein ComFC